MIKKNELDALVYLLDDTDEEVVTQVMDRILSLGKEVIPYLEEEWGPALNELQQERIEDIVHQIQFDAVKSELQAWVDTKEQDLFNGICILSKYQYPNLDVQAIDNQINKIKLDVWLELNYDLTSLEKVKIINRIFYETHGFSGNISNYHSPANSFINTVLENKKGNPITLAIIYSIVAQRLNIPIFGVNLPQHFVLAYKDDIQLETADTIDQESRLNPEMKGNILFYINPFNKGLVFTRANIEAFLKQLDIKPNDLFFEPCANIEILKRVLRNLAYAYSTNDQKNRLDELSELMTILGGELNINSDNDEFGEDDEDDLGFN